MSMDPSRHAELMALVAAEKSAEGGSSATWVDYLHWQRTHGARVSLGEKIDGGTDEDVVAQNAAADARELAASEEADRLVQAGFGAAFTGDDDEDIMDLAAEFAQMGRDHFPGAPSPYSWETARGEGGDDGSAGELESKTGK
jgi:hypothetical protein